MARAAGAGPAARPELPDTTCRWNLAAIHSSRAHREVTYWLCNV